MRDAPRVLDLFCGSGGLSLGLESSGFRVEWACEIDSDASDTYRSSHPETVLWTEDANTLLKRCADGEKGVPRQGQVDLLAGGPPCQGFSGYNRYRSPDDPRNSLVETYLAFVELLRPRCVLMENVPGMLQMEQGRTARLLLETLEGIGYVPQLGILQAGNYGLPQNRWRVFVFAVQGGNRLPEFPVPTHAFPRTTLFGATAFREHVVRAVDDPNSLFGRLLPNTTVGDAIRDLPPIANGGGTPLIDLAGAPLSPYQEALRDGLGQVTDHLADRHGEIMMKRIEAVPKRPGAGWLDLPEELQPRNLAKHGDRRYENRFGRLWWDGIFNTIVTLPFPYWGRFIHPEQDRVLSVRECARAQGFPDRVSFSGKIKSKYRQVGNAVPPPLAKAIGIEIMRAMGNRVEDESSWEG
jgi:DNA (cytosine-5)-methyltransferase 1